MEKLCIDVRGFSDEKKKRVQDAFFELGIKWADGCVYQYLGADQYGNVYPGGDAAIGQLMWCRGATIEQQLKHAITYTDLMRKAGLDESDPDVIISTPTAEDLERAIARFDAMAGEPDEKAVPKQVGELTVGLNVERVSDLQTIISDYMHLLDSIKDPYARGVIKSQITDLTDLQYKQLNGENNNA